MYMDNSLKTIFLLHLSFNKGRVTFLSVNVNLIYLTARRSTVLYPILLPVLLLSRAGFCGDRRRTAVHAEPLPTQFVFVKPRNEPSIADYLSWCWYDRLATKKVRGGNQLCRDRSPLSQEGSTGG